MFKFQNKSQNKKSIVNCPRRRRVRLWRKLSNVRKAGFTFVEVIVATFIFAVIMTAVVSTFASAFKTYRAGKAIQKDLESAQQAMNVMTKVLRTSSIESSTNTSLQAYDYSQDKCVVYQFSSSNNSLQSGSSTPSPPGDKSGCNFSGITASNMTTGTVTGNFYIIPSSANLAGKLTISAKVCPESGCDGNPRDEVKIQSTVSLRNKYKETPP